EGSLSPRHSRDARVTSPRASGRQVLGRQHLTALGLTFALSACGLRHPPFVSPAVSDRSELIEDIQAFQQTLGLEPTGNFLSYSDKTDAVDRCYFTGPLELPVSYAGLQLRQESK